MNYKLFTNLYKLFSKSLPSTVNSKYEFFYTYILSVLTDTAAQPLNQVYKL